MIDWNERADIFINRMEYHLTTFFFLFLLNFCVGLQPADKGANAKTKATLDFIGELPKQSIVLLEYIVVSIFITQNR